MRPYQLMYLFFVLLMGCQTRSLELNAHAQKPQNFVNTQRDAAPSGPIPSFFKKIFPHDEPLSRYGNPLTYRVDGQTYTVMKTASGFKSRGLASWYGTKFHRKKTSSGEKYDMYALTAAHKTLPLPTYIRVKNLSNGKEAVVKVNDRGPFHSGRILDLSYGAAVKLGLFPKGTAMVEIEALTQKKHIAHFYLQAGAFTSKTVANSLRAQLTKISRNSVFVEPYQHRFLVRIGPLNTRSVALQLKKLLEKQKINGAFVVLL